MGTYRNGFVPTSALPVLIDSGYNAIDGHWEQRLSRSTARKHFALVDLARRNTGRLLRIGEGWRCYRPYAAQVRAKQIWGIGAADPGTSSHGGYWEEQDTLAIDYGNWAYVYGNGDGRDTADKRNAFFRDCRTVGLAPGRIMRERGYPNEPWHVIDLDPWAAVPANGGDSKPLPLPDPEDLYEDEDDDMAKNGGFYYTRAKDNQRVNLIVNAGSGWWFEYTGSNTIPPNSNNGVAVAFDTGAYAAVTEGFATALKNSLDERIGSA